MVLGKKLGVEGSLGLHGAVRGLVLMARVCLSLFLGVGLSSFALWVGVTPLVSGFSGLALPCASEEGCSGTSCLATLVAKTKRNKKLMLNKEKKKSLLIFKNQYQLKLSGFFKEACGIGETLHARDLTNYIKVLPGCDAGSRERSQPGRDRCAEKHRKEEECNSSFFPLLGADALIIVPRELFPFA